MDKAFAFTEAAQKEDMWGDTWAGKLAHHEGRPEKHFE